MNIKKTKKEKMILVKLNEVMMKWALEVMHVELKNVKEKPLINMKEVMECGADVFDGYHSIDELYEFRKVYNAALFNQLHKDGLYDCHKSKKHYDGEECFGGGWFIVVAMLPGGQISNHYELKDWDLFHIPEVEKAKYEFDGHTPQDVLERLKTL